MAAGGGGRGEGTEEGAGPSAGGAGKGGGGARLSPPTGRGEAPQGLPEPPRPTLSAGLLRRVARRLVSVHESGWKAFDVTEAVNFWRQLGRPRQPLLLQVSVQREQPGPRAASAHRLVRFASQGPAGGGRGEPQLELHSLDLGRYG